MLYFGSTCMKKLFTSQKKSNWNFSQGYTHQNFPALLVMIPVHHVHKGRQEVSQQADATKPVEAIEKEGDDKHDVNDFTSQKEEVVEEHPMFLGELES